LLDVRVVKKGRIVPIREGGERALGFITSPTKFGKFELPSIVFISGSKSVVTVFALNKSLAQTGRQTSVKIYQQDQRIFMTVSFCPNNSCEEAFTAE
jgi:hypothetical protein